jgi:dipeptidyl-peptidase 4
MKFLHRVCQLLVASLTLSVATSAQDRLPLMPGYANYLAFGGVMSKIRARANTPSGIWVDNKVQFRTEMDPAGNTFDPTTLTWQKAAPSSADKATKDQRSTPERGRQFDTIYSPDKKLKAVHENGQVSIYSNTTSQTEIKAVKPFDALMNEAKGKRIKFGTGSWVYGEELDQKEAMWFSPDSRKLIAYKFDETNVPDYYVTLNQNAVQNKLYTEGYPKAGASNPVVDLYIFDNSTKEIKLLDVRFGKNGQSYEYVYGMSWAPDGNQFLYHRTNRQQNRLELVATDINKFSSRVVVSEESSGWVNNSPKMIWISDQQFLWETEKNGYKNYDLYDINKGLTRSVTHHKFEVESILKIEKETVWYLARPGKNPLHLQLFKGNLDGTIGTQLTEDGFNHSVSLSPDGKFFLDRYQNFDHIARQKLCNADGKVLKEFNAVESENPFSDSSYTANERFKCLAADGTTPIFGYLSKPTNYDPNKKYPVIVDVYGGPESGTGSETFRLPQPENALGFITVWIDGRGTNGRGKEFRQSVYRKLGTVEIDDQAAVVTQLAKSRKDFDGTRVGINGTSYGGYASLMALVRHPDVFAAASCSSSVTSWIHYDTIYTERYMDTPQNNPDGYHNGSAMTYARDLQGRLLLFYGTADDNVHPSNTHQMIAALDKVGKSYELVIGVDRGHAGVNFSRMMEFFIECLVNNSAGSWRKN